MPKGKAEKGESIRETAVREVIEETGIEKLKIDKYFSNTFLMPFLFVGISIQND